MKIHYVLVWIWHGHRQELARSTTSPLPQIYFPQLSTPSAFHHSSIPTYSNISQQSIPAVAMKVCSLTRRPTNMQLAVQKCLECVLFNMYHVRHRCLRLGSDVCVEVFETHSTQHTKHGILIYHHNACVSLCLHLYKIETRLHHINRSQKYLRHGLKRTCPIQWTDPVSLFITIDKLATVCFSAALHVCLFQGLTSLYRSLILLQSLANFVMTAAWIMNLSTK